MASTRGIGFLNVITGSVRTKTYGFAAFTLFVVVVLIIGAIRPTVLTISRISREIRDKTFLNDQLKTKIDSLATLSSQYSSISSDTENLPLIFPAEGNFSLFMANVEEISKGLGFTLNGISFGKLDLEDIDINPNAVAPVSARLNVSGNRQNLIKLLESLESLPMYPTVRQVSYSIPEAGTAITNISIELVIYQVEDPEFFK